tara:strand:+ start:1869 stop:2531 length:663 start_codon:yes stop_codon:yes gene_type:complete
MVGAIFIGTFLPLALLMLLLRHSRPVFASFCWGMLAFLIVYLTSPALYTLLGVSRELSVTAVYVGPPYEEFLKVFPVVLAAIFSGRSIIPFYYILGMASGIGFSIEENLNFLVEFHRTDGESMALMVLRSFSTCLMHGVATGFIGYALTLSRRQSGKNKFLIPVAAWAASTVYHGLFNWLMISDHLVFGLLFALAFFFLFLYRMKVIEPTAAETRGTMWQ